MWADPFVMYMVRQGTALCVWATPILHLMFMDVTLRHTSLSKLCILACSFELLISLRDMGLWHPIGTAIQ